MTSLLCRLPLPITGIAGLNFHENRTIYMIINSVATLLLYINFTIDPLIYVLRMREIRLVICSLIGKCFKCQIVDIESESEMMSGKKRSGYYSVTQSISTWKNKGPKDLETLYPENRNDDNGLRTENTETHL